MGLTLNASACRVSSYLVLLSGRGGWRIPSVG